MNNLIKKNTYKHNCLYCQTLFTCNNTRRKFCPNSNCHDCFHNSKKKRVYDRHKDFLKIIENNFQILHNLDESDGCKISINFLNQAGFKFDACKKISKLPGSPPSLMYEYGDYGLIPQLNEEYKLIFLKH